MEMLIQRGKMVIGLGKILRAANSLNGKIAISSNLHCIYRMVALLFIDAINYHEIYFKKTQLREEE